MRTIALSIIRWIRRSFLCISVTLALTACDSGGSSVTQIVEPPSPPPPPPPPPHAAWDGVFFGSISIDSEQAANAVLTADGHIRVHIGNVWGDPVHPNGSAQFVGQFDIVGEQGLGSGIVVGQECVIYPAGRFCTTPAAAEISITTARSDIFAGEIRVETSEGVESWPFEMTWSDWLSTDLESLEGTYQENLAEFAVDDVVIVNVDNEGALFFQSPLSGCVGNGVMTNHPGGPSSVFDAVVSIENCGAEFEALNGSYAGLGVRIPEDWYYWPTLLLWLSTSDDAAVPRAISTNSYGQ